MTKEQESYGVIVLWGGETKAHSDAQEDSWKKILSFLQQHISKVKGKKMGRQSKSKTITLKKAKRYVECTMYEKRRLDLSFKDLSTVPKCIRKLCDLDELDLSRNWITEVPDFIDCFTTLIVLDLHSNCLEELPVTICRLPRLLVLNLCNNRLTSLPKEFGQLNTLETLNLSINRLSALPASIIALKELRCISLCDNQFMRVPVCLSKFKKLEKVNLDRNPLFDRRREVKVTLAKNFYMVNLNHLCNDCQNKCQIEGRKMEEAESEDETESPTNPS
ncbi:leucine-rich repeat-containing protein 18-like [Cololabis saira]|uniref:leucine-rich repeat-containing protein 18-like n=1 Tax=Cololabis saira TaxID=129043 RepID=UPI002AD22754|nr:leucine-rich repeat-containing protein 18-like [Cololabis saira]